MPNPFTNPRDYKQNPDFEYVDHLDPFSDASMMQDTLQQSRFNETQKEWFWKEQQMTYENSVDASDQMIWELYLKARSLGMFPKKYENIHEFLMREDVVDLLITGE